MAQKPSKHELNAGKNYDAAIRNAGKGGGQGGSKKNIKPRKADK